MGQCGVIDESMVLLKSMFTPKGLSQYMPAKPIKHGIKFFCLVTSFTFYLINFHISNTPEDKPPDKHTYLNLNVATD